jgi:tetratricopeptide (TPR) repeat protein
MNRNDFLRMIEKSGPSDRTTIGEVNELINIFPYFQSAYMLLLKGLQNTSDVRFENQLRVSAMRIADREVLYYLLKKEEAKVQVAEKILENADPGPVPVESEAGLMAAETEEPGITPEAYAFKVPEVAGDNLQTVLDSAKNSEDLINEIEKESLLAGADRPRQNKTLIIADEMVYYDSDATIILIDGDSGEVEEKITYMDPGFSAPEHADLLELEQEQEETETIAPDPAKEPVSHKQLQAELIDKFIIANPRIEPKREKTDVPIVDISTPYVEERGGFVSETLARIYIKQGYYSRAIDIYEKLSLKFPEKSSYFASQIEKVKELLKK